MKEVVGVVVGGADGSPNGDDNRVLMADQSCRRYMRGILKAR